MKLNFDKNYLSVLLSATTFGLIVPAGAVMRNNGYSLIEVLVLPTLFVCLMIGVAVSKDLINFFKVPLKFPLLYFISCLIFYVGQFMPLYVGLSVSLTVFLLYTQPIWTVVFSCLFLHEKLKKRDLISLGIIFSGLILLISPWNDFSYSGLGFTLAVLSGMGMAGWIMLNSYYAKQNLAPLTLTFYSCLGSALPFILLGVFVFPQLFNDPALYEFSLVGKSYLSLSCVLIYAAISFILGNVLFFQAAKKVNNVHLGLMLLLEPVVAVIIDALFLDAQITSWIVLGGVFIILGNAYMVLGEKNSH